MLQQSYPNTTRYVQLSATTPGDLPYSGAEQALKIRKC
jgi:hypothetical protein